MEEEAECIYKDERGLLLDDEAASTRDIMSVLYFQFHFIWISDANLFMNPIDHPMRVVKGGPQLVRKIPQPLGVILHLAEEVAKGINIVIIWFILPVVNRRE